jgi:hypothetical protein
LFSSCPNCLKLSHTRMSHLSYSLSLSSRLISSYTEYLPNLLFLKLANFAIWVTFFENVNLTFLKKSSCSKK